MPIRRKGLFPEKYRNFKERQRGGPPTDSRVRNDREAEGDWGSRCHRYSEIVRHRGPPR